LAASASISNRNPIFSSAPRSGCGGCWRPENCSLGPAARAAKTKAAEVGDMMLSMLRGEAGRQARELDELIAWLKTQPRPDVICLSNALLVGMARKLKTELGATIICTLQGEDAFLDGLPDSHRGAAWQLLRERAADVDHFIAPSRYFRDLMTRRLGLPPENVSVVYNGISLDGYEVQGQKSEVGKQAAPVLGYLARMSKTKVWTRSSRRSFF
jgi:hypothetical protein